MGIIYQLTVVCQCFDASVAVIIFAARDNTSPPNFALQVQDCGTTVLWRS
jgi:hypothetical protein